jgi:hypothetical protein
VPSPPDGPFRIRVGDLRTPSGDFGLNGDTSELEAEMCEVAFYDVAYQAASSDVTGPFSPARVAENVDP